MEQPLLPYENCCLGSINLSNMVITYKDDLSHFDGCEVDWGKLRETVKTGVLFLNRVLDKSELPIPECQDAMEKTRKIGLGIMGLHDMLIQLGLPYDSEEGRKLAGDVMKFISEEADTASRVLGDSEGWYDAYRSDGSCIVRRNANLTTIAPTGTLSMIADCSSGCEPYYSAVTKKTVLDGEEFLMFNKWLPQAGREHYEEYGELREEDWDLFKGAEDISWESHIRMQAILQKYVDSSISKTINMPNDATVEDIKDAYELAWKLGCKGITVFRDGSRGGAQVLSSGTEKNDSPGFPGGLDYGSDDSSCSGSEVCVGSTGEGDPRDEETTGDIIDSFADWPVPYKIDLPDELQSKRYRVRDHEGNKVYFNVCTMDDKPVEVFARLAEEKQDSYWNTICRLVSLCLRSGMLLDDVTKQLRKSSGSVADTPSKLARILDKYKVSEEEDLYKSESFASVVDKEVMYELLEKSLRDKADCCPECGSLTQPGGGCETCPDCGWSRCS